MSLLDRIKLLCSKYNYNLASLERAAGLGQGTIRRWNKNIPSVEKLLIVANLLHTNADYLLTGKKFISIENLNDLGVQKVDDYIKDLLENPKYVNTDSISQDMSNTINTVNNFTIPIKQK